MQSIIVGYGEIGKAVREVFCDTGNPFDIVDLDINEFDPKKKYQWMHVAIPYSKDFVQIVNNYVDTIKPYGTIIHSTVPVGTTRKIKGRRYHAPVRGRHADLARGIKSYEMFVSAENMPDQQDILVYFSSRGIVCNAYAYFEITEAAKLLSLLQYGINIEFARYAKKLCEKHDLDYDFVVKKYSESYNRGIQYDNPLLAKTILEPPEGKIGGHCVLPAIQILNNDVEEGILKRILELNNAE